jgi:hypothetical protein
MVAPANTPAGVAECEVALLARNADSERSRQEAAEDILTRDRWLKTRRRPPRMRDDHDNPDLRPASRW